jgi:hypothetical protein
LSVEGGVSTISTDEMIFLLSISSPCIIDNKITDYVITVILIDTHSLYISVK